MGILHRSAKGKTIDMAAMRSKNEYVRAVGNMNVNSRGDVIDSNGNIINDNNKRVNEHYMKSVVNRARAPARQVLVTQEKQQQLQPEAIEVEDVYAHPIQTMPIADDVSEFTSEELEFDKEDESLELPKKTESAKKSNVSKKVE
jgi:hypothetical protein